MAGDPPKIYYYVPGVASSQGTIAVDDDGNKYILK